MLKKLIILFVSLMFFLPSFAGEVEDSLAIGRNVLLYLHMPQCGYCKLFNSRYDDAMKKYNGKFEFLKINVESEYGSFLMRKYSASYVPYVLMLNKKQTKNIPVHCIMDSECFYKELNNF